MELSKHKQAEYLLEGLNIKNSDLIDEALDVVNIYGSYKDALKEATKIEFKSGTQILFTLLEKSEKSSEELILKAKAIVTLMHDIKSVVSKESISLNKSEKDVIKKLNLRESFKLSQEQIYVFNEIGGREFILNILFQEPNSLEQKVVVALEKYRVQSKLESVPSLSNVIQKLGY
ncbi:MAG: hypothetical protein GQ570_08180 [Helicobacteraceae bacterium]|nr:hypothetical protein [Helicobacteraceae bacterium]